jgi:hypothetical protein
LLIAFSLGPILAFAKSADPDGTVRRVVVLNPTDHELGSEKWSAGLVNVLFNGSSRRFQYGYLLSWQHSFAGDDDLADVNVAALQPFAFYQLGGGTYLRAAPI